MALPGESHTIVAGSGLRECCTVAENLEVVESKAHVEVKRCKVCQRRHFRAFMHERPAGSYVEIK